jgi:hypothetical protein
MDTRDSDGLPARLEATRRRFEQWRRTRHGRARIPDALWAAAVRMARSYGVCQTAKVLRLDYYGLKKRLEQESAASAGPDSGTLTTFLELPAPPRGSSAECVLELEDTAGTKKRVHVKGLEIPALAGLIRSLWES